MIKQIEHTGKIKMSFHEENSRTIEITPVIVFEGELGSTNAIITDDSCYILLSLKKDGIFRPNLWISHEEHEVLQSLDCTDRWRIELLKKKYEDPEWRSKVIHHYKVIKNPDTGTTETIPVYCSEVDDSQENYY